MYNVFRLVSPVSGTPSHVPGNTDSGEWGENELRVNPRTSRGLRVKGALQLLSNGFK